VPSLPVEYLAYECPQVLELRDLPLGLSLGIILAKHDRMLTSLLEKLRGLRPSCERTNVARSFLPNLAMGLHLSKGHQWRGSCDACHYAYGPRAIMALGY